MRNWIVAGCILLAVIGGAWLGYREGRVARLDAVEWNWNQQMLGWRQAIASETPCEVQDMQRRHLGWMRELDIFTKEFDFLTIGLKVYDTRMSSDFDSIAKTSNAIQDEATRKASECHD